MLKNSGAKESLQEVVSGVDSLETQKVEQVKPVNVDENGGDNAFMITLPGKNAFSDEVIAFKPEALQQKHVLELKQTSENANLAAKEAFFSQAIKSQDIDQKKGQAEVEATPIHRKKETGVNT